MGRIFEVMEGLGVYLIILRLRGLGMSIERGRLMLGSRIVLVGSSGIYRVLLS